MPVSSQPCHPSLFVETSEPLALGDTARQVYHAPQIDSDPLRVATLLRGNADMKHPDVLRSIMTISTALLHMNV